MKENVECKFLFIAMFIICVMGEEIKLAPVPSIERDVCRQLCANKALNIPSKDATSQCERGCRFFNIAMNTNWPAEKSLDLNVTKDQCCQYCSDAYADDVKGNCFTGCCEMQQLQRDTWLFYMEQVGDGNVLEVEVSLEGDPAMWQPSYPLSTNSMYKIPQTMLRTMPLRQELSEMINGKPWTPCAHNNEIPRWLVGMIAVVLTFITIYVSFILPSRSQSDPDITIENVPILDDQDGPTKDGLYYHFKVTIPDEQLYPKKGLISDSVYDYTNTVDESDEKKLLTLNEFLSEEIYLNIPPPPKYSLLPEGDDYKI